MIWGRLQHPWQETALRAQIARWAWTRHMPGQNIAGVGTSCVGFVVGVLSGLTGLSFEVPEHLPSTLRQLEAMRLVEMPIWPEEGVLPADVLVAGPAHELHVYLADVTPLKWWHCSVSAGVCPVAHARLKLPLRRLFRPTGKSLWLV